MVRTIFFLSVLATGLAAPGAFAAQQAESQQLAQRPAEPGAIVVACTLCDAAETPDWLEAVTS